MDKRIQKIEDLLDKVASDVQFDPQNQDANLETPHGTISFPRMLDYSFPREISSAKVAQIGEIIYVGDGICHVSGLERATIDEVVEVNTESGIQKALVLSVNEKRVEAVVLGDYSKIKRGDQVKSSNARLKVPAGPKVLGRTINALGQPVDGKGPIKVETYREVEFAAPSVLDRKPVTQPMHSGIISIDTIIPVGRGQRELVIGDRKTGKTRTMLDFISNQKGNGVVCVYVGVGIQATKAKSAMELLEARGALDYTVMVLALADEPPPLQYIAPYVGAAIGEYFMYKGQHALIIYDDLSKQAKAYRQVSLLMKRSPGRDAYPGDIFFLHSRLLERAAKLSDQKGGGSLTALPVAETQSGDVSDYIVTNLMSITDGHIYLDTNLLHEGILPAVDPATSVSRIGSKVQTKLLAKVGELAGRVLARYADVKSFESINTELADDTVRDIKRGKRVREIMSQDSNLNMSDDEQVIMLAIATSNRMDHLELDHSVIFKENIIPFYREQNLQELRKLCKTAKKMEEIDSMLDHLFLSFCKKFKLPLLEKTT